MSTPTKTLDLRDLETVYDRLAQAIDMAGDGKAALFLVKLALLNAQDLTLSAAQAAFAKINRQTMFDLLN